MRAPNDMLGIQRATLTRQMAFRQDSNDTEISIKHGLLAPPVLVPESPRPQKETNPENVAPLMPPPTMVKVPVSKSDSASSISSIIYVEKKK